jgi:hypothetical protein
VDDGDVGGLHLGMGWRDVRCLHHGGKEKDEEEKE